MMEAPDVFVHVTGLDDSNIETLAIDDRVSFEVGTNTKNGRPKAIKLRLLMGGVKSWPTMKTPPL
jgi:cold shock CspA family protein